jgi:hypothetical protein
MEPPPFLILILFSLLLGGAQVPILDLALSKEGGDHMEKKSYTEPQIVDYGSIAEMTAGQSFRTNADVTITTGMSVINHTSGPCYPGTHSSGGSCTP